MHETANNTFLRKNILKHLILELHAGANPADVRMRLASALESIPYDEVVEVEQELISEGLPVEEVLKLCDIHGQVLDGRIDLSRIQSVPPGHPVDTFRRENEEIANTVRLVQRTAEMFADAGNDTRATILRIHALLNGASDIDKHYKRKELLLFPFLEKKGITGPPAVMWGKDDEIRALLKAARSALAAAEEAAADEAKTVYEMMVVPALNGIVEMIKKENEILLPMSLDALSEAEWYQVYEQTTEIGFCLYDPKDEWTPSGIAPQRKQPFSGERIQLPTGALTYDELLGILNSLPIDITFVDKNDKVRFFSESKDGRIFARNRAVLQRDVRLCHPPQSVGKVEQILNDFRSGAQSRAPFWIQMRGKFVHIEYFAVHNEKGEFLGTLEVTQDLTDKRVLSGEQRLLQYRKESAE